GVMWECPDFFELDGKYVLLISPQDMQPSGFEYHNGNGTVCLIGSYDENSGTFAEEKDQAIDYGIDFYAPQTLLAEDGRRIMIGWMQNWDACAIRNPSELWAGQMSLPRELSIRDGRLYQQPVRELCSLYKDSIQYKDVPVGTTDTVVLEGIRGRCIDMTIHVRPADPSGVFHKFSVRFAQKDSLRTAVSFRPHEKTVKIDRKYSGSCRAIVHQRRCFVEGSENGVITLRLILDRFSAEVFINEGRYVMTASLFTDLSAEGISFFADGEAVIDVEKHQLS
ncbi:MAG: GH32 C-terminal domain-containing protein, partial [Eubacteriales bacterium]